MTKTSQIKLKAAVFWDRDGVITQNIKGCAPNNTKDLYIYPEVLTVIQKSSDLGFINIIVSNQPDIALGKIDLKTQIGLEKKFQQLTEGFPFARIYYCNHHPKALEKINRFCDCRKPKPGMLLKAAKECGIDFARSIMIGDRTKDIEAGQAVGVTTIFVDFGEDPRERPLLTTLSKQPDHIVKHHSEIIPILENTAQNML